MGRRDSASALSAAAPRCVASLLACCAGKRFVFPQLRTLAGSNPSACPQESALGRYGLRALCFNGWDGGIPRPPYRRPRPAASLRSLRAALENASCFLSSAPLRVRIPPLAHKKAPWAAMGSGRSVLMAGTEGFRVRLIGDRAPLRRFAPCVLRWKTLRVSSAPHPCGFESLRLPTRKRPGPLWAQGALF